MWTREANNPTTGSKPIRGISLAQLTLLIGLCISFLIGAVIGVDLLLAQIIAVTLLGILLCTSLCWVLGLVPTLFVLLATQAILLPHYFHSTSQGYLISTVITAALALLLLVFGRWDERTRPADLGILLLVSAQTFPLFIHGEISSILAVTTSTLFLYLGVRVANVSERLLINLFSVCGLVLAIVGLLQRFNPLHVYIPLVPIEGTTQNVMTRAVGFYTNPNTYGVVLSSILVFLLLARATGWRIIAMYLILAGVFASHSREALVGLVLAVGVSRLFQIRDLIRYSILGILVVLTLESFFPATTSHFDPRGFSEDQNFLARVDQWILALEYIPRSLWIGYGDDLPIAFVDNAYLGWLLRGGLFGALLWVATLSKIMSASKYWPALVVLLGASFLGNAFTGPNLAIIIILSASQVRSPILASERVSQNVLGMSVR